MSRATSLSGLPQKEHFSFLLRLMTIMVRILVRNALTIACGALRRQGYLDTGGARPAAKPSPTGFPTRRQNVWSYLCKTSSENSVVESMPGLGAGGIALSGAV